MRIKNPKRTVTAITVLLFYIKKEPNAATFSSGVFLNSTDVNKYFYLF